MSANKNQHYVPQVYLRAFSEDNNGKSISIFLIEAEKEIQGAPIKSQCSSDYFYGEDLVLEKQFSQFEGEYRTLLNKIVEDGYNLSRTDSDHLKNIWAVQYLRTEGAAKHLSILSKDLSIIAKNPSLNLSLKESVIHSLLSLKDTLYSIDDLEVALIKNSTNIPFITSDNPAILTNRWHLASLGRFQGFGMQSAGIILLLPLTPCIMCVIYDKDFYSLSTKNGWVKQITTGDVEALNQHQILNCNYTIFFKGILNITSENLTNYKKNRIQNRHSLNIFYEDPNHSGRFTLNKPNQMVSEMVHIEGIYCKPTTWPSFLVQKSKATFYDNGSGAGYIRQKFIDNTFQKRHK